MTNDEIIKEIVERLKIDAGSLFWKEVLQTGITVYETI